MRRRPALVLLVALALVSACGRARVIETGSGPLQTPTAPPRQTEADAGEDSPSETGPLRCDARTEAELDEVVGAQLRAIAAGDYRGALEFASSEFRADMDAERFREVLEEGFPLVTRAEGHEIGDCRAAGDAAEAVVAIRGADDELVLVYGFSREDGRWLVDGATTRGAPVASPSDGETST